VWDLRNCSESIKTLKDHHKHVTCLTLTSDRSICISGAIDGLLKIYSTELFENVHTMNYSAPVVSCDISQNSHNTFLAVAMSDKTINVRTRINKSEGEQPVAEDGDGGSTEDTGTRDKSQEIDNSSNTKSFRQNMLAGKHLSSNSNESRVDTSEVRKRKAVGEIDVIQHPKKGKLVKSERLLQKFDHTEALLKALSTVNRTSVQKDVQFLFSLLLELDRRHVLETCFRAMDMFQILALVKYLNAHMCNKSMGVFLMHVFETLLPLLQKPVYLKNGQLRKLLKSAYAKITNKLQVSELLLSFNSQLEILSYTFNN